MSETERRRIVYAPQPDDDSLRWKGTVERPDGLHRDKRWHGGTVENVIGQMDRDLGPCEETDYEVQG
jgi:hypothetical protein